MSVEKPVATRWSGALLPATAIFREENREYPMSEADVVMLRRKRSVVQTVLADAFDALLLPLGYARTAPGDWRKTSIWGRSAFNFQKDSRGFSCFINAAVLGRWERGAGANANTADGFSYQRLAAFCPDIPVSRRPDALSYVRLHDDDAFLQAVLAVVEARIIPWLEARHRAGVLLGSRAPADMRAVPLFME